MRRLVVTTTKSVQVGPKTTLAYVDAGSGIPLLFVHGIPTDYRAWSEQVAFFSEKGFRVISYSRRLAQPNQNEENYAASTIQNNAGDLLSLIETLELAPVHLVGHSYGGFIAAYFASQNPKLLRTLCLVEPAISTLLIKDPNNAMQFLSLFFSSPSTALSAASFKRKSLDPCLAAFKKGEYNAALKYNIDGIMNRQDAFPSFSDPVKAMFKDNEKTVAEQDTVFPSFTQEDAAKIIVPSLLINGENSPKFFHTIVDRFARGAPQASKVQRIPDAAHFPHVENPAAFNAALLPFLNTDDKSKND